MTQVAGVDEARYRTPASNLVTAEKRYLAAMGKLADLEDGKLTAWSAIRDELTDASRAVLTASAQVQALRLGTTPVVPEQQRLDGAVSEIDAVVERAQTKLRSWRRRVQRVKAENARRRSMPTAAAGYRGQMQALIDDYFQDRDRTRAFYNSADTMGGSAARAAIATFQADRTSTISGMNALTPPPGAADAHREMVSIVESSRAGLDFALEAVEQYEDGPYTSITDAPAWSQFDARSSEVTSRFGPAKARWQSVAGGGSGERTMLPIPERPSV
jgi:hypothetical protein